MTIFQPCCLPAAIGSLPYPDAELACDLVLRYLPDVPVWPQLPARSSLESMYVQFFERFPGAVVEGDKVRVRLGPRFDEELVQLYADYLGERSAGYALNPRVAAGFAAMTRRWRNVARRPLVVKGQVTGPISAGLQITDQELRPILYDEVLADALGKYLNLVAREQERALEEVGVPAMVFVDEPYLSAIGSGIIQINRELAQKLLAEVLRGIHGLKGIHCCGNTDWSLVLSTAIDVLSFDAYDFADTLALYADDLSAFLARGGILAWGIVPTDPRVLAAEAPESLMARLLAGIDGLAAKGFAREDLLPISLITPACGLGTLEPDQATHALEVTSQVADLMRRRFFAGD